MHNILLMGAGKIGEMIAVMLAQSGSYNVTVADNNEAALGRIAAHKNIDTCVVDAADEAAMAHALSDKFAVLSACPFAMTRLIAPAAHKAGVHYFDLTEDVQSTRLTKTLAKTGTSAFIPQCGLAPGFISIAAYDLAKRFDSLHNVHMRVGALPQYPSNAMKYNLTWSTDGLVNEYCNPCEAIIDGELREVPPLEELEHFSFDGVEYEAFNTSGGLGTLCETLKGKVKNLNYRTARYPGHRDILKVLLHDLRLNERREMMKDIFEYALPVTRQDVVLIYVSVSGEKNGQFTQETYANKVYPKDIGGKHYTAIQVTTAAGICTMLDLVADNKLPQQGFVRQEDANFQDFIENRFGSAYARSVEAGT